MIDDKKLKELLAERSLQTCRYLLPGGKKKGNEWVVGSLDGSSGSSLTVHLGGQKGNVWADHATGEAGSNLLDLWLKVRGLDSAPEGFRSCCQEAAEWLQVDLSSVGIRPEGGDTAKATRRLRMHGGAKGAKSQNPLNPDTAVRRFSSSGSERLGSRPGARPLVSALSSTDFVRPSIDAGGPLEGRGPVWTYLTGKRGLDSSTLEAYRIQKVAMAQGTRALPAYVLPFYDEGGAEPCHIKRVAIERRKKTRDDGTVKEVKIMDSSKGTRLCLFGKHLAIDRASPLVITEGELDAMSWHQSGFQAVSVPNGAGNVKWIENDFDWISEFAAVYIAFDQDEPGRRGALTVADRMEVPVWIVRFPNEGDDANDILVDGRPEVFHEAMNAAAPYKPEGVFLLAEAYQLMLDEGEVEGFDSGLFGSEFKIRPKEVSIWTGYSGHGKSSLLTQLVCDLTHSEIEGGADQSTLIAGLEATPGELAKNVVRQQLEVDPMILVDERADSGIAQEVRAKVSRLLEERGSKILFYCREDEPTVPELIDAMAYSFRRYGVTQFVVDSLMKVQIGLEDYQAQKDFVSELCDFVKSYPVHVHLVAHSRKPSGQDQNESSPPNKHDVMGGVSITNLVHNGLTVHRNKAKATAVREAKDDLEKAQKEGNSGSAIEDLKKALHSAQTTYDTEVVLWKQRATGTEGEYRLWFDQSSGRFDRSRKGATS